MHDEQRTKEDLLEILKQEITALLCADDVSEEEKAARLKLVQAIMEHGVA
jgi:hypothetical protein